MQTALALEPEEARLLLTHPILQFARGVSVADRDVALFPKRMVREVIGLQVVVNIFVSPVDDWVNLYPPPLAKASTVSFSREELCWRRSPASQAVAFNSSSARFIGSTLFS